MNRVRSTSGLACTALEATREHLSAFLQLAKNSQSEIRLAISTTLVLLNSPRPVAANHPPLPMNCPPRPRRRSTKRERPPSDSTRPPTSLLSHMSSMANMKTTRRPMRTNPPRIRASLFIRAIPKRSPSRSSSRPPPAIPWRPPPETRAPGGSHTRCNR